MKFASPARVGVPDMILLHQGRAMFIEVKSPTGRGRLAPIQVRTHEQFRQYGQAVAVIDNKERGADVIEQFAGLRPTVSDYTPD